MRSARRHHRGACLVTGLLLLVTGCASSAHSPSTATKGRLTSLAFANATDADPQLKLVGDTMQRLVTAAGASFTRFDNKFDPGTTLQNAQLIAARKPQLVVEWSAVADANSAVGEQFKRAGLPCIAMSVAIPGCALINQDNALIGRQAGAYAASVAKQRGWTAADTTLLLVNAPFIGSELNALVANFYVGYAAAFPAMKQVSAAQITPTTTKIGADNAVIVDGKGQLEASNAAARQALARIPSGRHIVVGALINDDSALGAYRALDQDGRAKDALVVSAGAGKNGLEQLRTNPNWIADGSVFFEVWPQYVLAMARALVAGYNLPALTPAPQLLITKQNVDQYYSASGSVIADPSVPAAARYLTAFGLK